MTYFGRFLLLFMVVLNAGFFFWNYRQALIEGDADPAPGSAHEDATQGKRLLLLSELPVQQPQPEPAAEAAPVQGSADAEAQAPVAEAAAERLAGSGDVCQELGPLRLAAEATELQTRLEQEGFTVFVQTRAARAVTGYWVLMDAFAGRAAAGEALERLQQDGVADVALVRRNGASAISLGIYKNRSAAARRLAGLQDLDYRARIEEMAEEDQTYWLEVRGEDEETLRAALDAVRSAGEGKSDLRVQPCT